MTKKITKIDALSKLAAKKRVAAYARVSSGKDAMLHSLSAQVNQYKKLIQENPEWLFVGVYADEALTGTKDSRTEFQQLLKDCRAGKIDMIITKSISRFARNTVTLLKTVRDLNAINVDVFFEEQNIHSISSDGEMVLTLLASFAQEESRSVSDNMKWRIKKEFENGILWGGRSSLGYKLVNKQFIVTPEEAKVVKLIYQLYIDGHGADSICKTLDLKGIEPMYTKKWGHSSIMKILKNRNYTGDLILQKTYRENHLTKRQIINTGELDKYFIKDNHEAIISREIFEKAQKIRKKRANKNKPHSPRLDYPFLCKVKCGICGSSYTRKIMRQKLVWLCSLSVKMGQKVCNAKLVPDNIIVEASNHVLNMEQYDDAIFNSRVNRIIVMPNRNLEFHMKDDSIMNYHWEHPSRSKSWTHEMKEKARRKSILQHQGGKQDA
ncbi:recombinase family protein [Liberiplasma polymorphum]|uniref:recombinase family protein n=1 Tax=Liberiplasma polymorphum TaxID=3374570 RepID=UPI00377312BA